MIINECRLATTVDGSILITATFSDTNEIFDEPDVSLITSSNLKDTYIIKLDQYGEMQWSTELGIYNSVRPVLISIADCGNIYMAGISEISQNEESKIEIGRAHV